MKLFVTKVTLSSRLQERNWKPKMNGGISTPMFRKPSLGLESLGAITSHDTCPKTFKYRNSIMMISYLSFIKDDQTLV